MSAIISKDLHKDVVAEFEKERPDAVRSLKKFYTTNARGAMAQIKVKAGVKRDVINRVAAKLAEALA